MRDPSKVQILIVEDVPIARTAALIIIENLDFCHAEFAENGEKAVELLSQNTYDFVFMDLGLGEGLDGYQVTQKIRSEAGPNQNVPIVALTAHSKESVEEKCLESGMQEVVRKPLELKILNHLIQKYVTNVTTS